MAPVYKTIGNSVTTKEITRNKATKLRVVPSNRFSKIFRNGCQTHSKVFRNKNNCCNN